MTREEAIAELKTRYFSMSQCLQVEELHKANEAIDIAIEALQTEPKIIRCCQCKYAEVADSEDSQDGYTCQFHRGSIWFSGSYCSWAERRQDG